MARRLPLAASALALWALGGSLARANDPVPGPRLMAAWEAGEGARVKLPAPPGASAIASASLPEVDTSQLSDARVVLRRGVGRGPSGPEHQGVSVYAICVRAPGSGAGAEFEDAAFDKLDAKAQEEMARVGRVDSFAPGPQRERNNVSERTFSGEGAPSNGARPGLRLRLDGKHLLGYVGQPPEMLLCSLACLETCADGSRMCPGLLDGAAVEASFVAPPKPTMLAQLAYASVRRPVAAVGLLLGLGLMAAGVALAAWPAKKKPLG